MTRNLTVTLIMLLASSCDVRSDTAPKPEKRPAPVEKAYITNAQVPAFRTEATSACECVRKGGSAAQCWESFNAKLERYHHTTAASACGPGSSQIVEFELPPPPGKTLQQAREEGMSLAVPGPEMIVTTEFPYGSCSEAEVPKKRKEYEKRTGMGGC